MAFFAVKRERVWLPGSNETDGSHKLGQDDLSGRGTQYIPWLHTEARMTTLHFGIWVLNSWVRKDEFYPSCHKYGF